MLPGPVAQREPTPVTQVGPGIPAPRPIIAVPNLQEIPLIQIPLAQLVDRLPRTGGEPATLGLRVILGAALMGFGSFLMLRRR